MADLPNPTKCLWSPVPRTPVATHKFERSSTKVAIIDYEPLNDRLIRRQLEWLGHRFLVGLSDPLVAIETLKDYLPDLVLMDVVMPGLSGIELLSLMWEHPRLQSIPAITLTASRDRATWLNAAQARPPLRN